MRKKRRPLNQSVGPKAFAVRKKEGETLLAQGIVIALRLGRDHLSLENRPGDALVEEYQSLSMGAHLHRFHLAVSRNLHLEGPQTTVAQEGSNFGWALISTRHVVQ